jgi:hypothetical protein
LYFGGTAYLGLPTNTEFKKILLKTFYAGAAHMAAPEMQILN